MAAGGWEVAADGHSQSRDQVRLPQPARGVHEVCHHKRICLSFVFLTVAINTFYIGIDNNFASLFQDVILQTLD